MTTANLGLRRLGTCLRGAARRGGAAALPGMLAVALAATTAAAAAETSVTARFSTDRPRPYEKEPFTLTLLVEARGVEISQTMDLTPGPEAGAIAIESYKELVPEKTLQDQTVVTRRRFRCQTTALRTGPVRVAPTLQVRLQFRRPGLIGSFMEERPLRVQVQPLDLQILPVPTAGRPPRWSGAIGRFDFQADAAPRELAVGDLAKVRMVVTGRGYTAGMQPPRLDAGEEFKVYEPTALPADDGRMEYEQVVVPLSTNAAAVPAASFCFFDTAAGRYVTLTRGPFPLKFHARQAVMSEVYRPGAETSAAGRTVSAPRFTRQWLVRAGATAFIVLAIAAAMAAIQGALRRRWRAAAAGLAAAAACAGAAVAATRIGASAEPGSVMVRDAAARVAPSDRALETFPLTHGTRVRWVEHTADGWVCVRRGQDAGWVPADAVGEAGGGEGQ